jgi:hypothetical protein
MKQPKRKSAGQRSSPKQPEEANREGIYAAAVAYISRVKVEPVEGKIRSAHIPAKEEPVYFGVHSEIAEHYGVSTDVEEPIPARSTTW